MCDTLKAWATVAVLLGLVAWHVFIEMPLEETTDDEEWEYEEL